jgi:hypothetical protein
LSNVIDVLGKKWFERSFFIQCFAQTGVRQTRNLPGRPECRASPMRSPQRTILVSRTREIIANSNTNSHVPHTPPATGNNWIIGWMIGKLAFDWKYFLAHIANISCNHRKINSG